MSQPADKPEGELSEVEPEFWRATVDQLQKLPAPNISDKSVAERIDDERLNELRDARRYRKAIVRFTLKAVGGLVLAATGFMGAYIWSQWGNIEASVMIGYFTSVVVESIGVLYVISRYLFPNSGPQRDAGSSQS